MKHSTKSYFGLGQVPIGIGAALKGCNIPETIFRNPNRLHIVDFRAMTSACPHNCFHCFTDKQQETLPLAKIKNVIDQLDDMNAWTIYYDGEGETTLDPNFFPIIEYTQKKGIQSVVFSEAATKLRERDFVRRLYDTGASVVVKCDSLFDPEYQNWVVGDKADLYFKQRNEAVELLIKEGFAAVSDDGTTRLGFDMVVSRLNVSEVERTLRYCRERNIWIIFAFYLPAGRSGSENFDQTLFVSEEKKESMRSIIKKVDREFGFEHPMYNNFATAPCMELVQIYGDGRVSPCPGNETIIGNINDTPIKTLHKMILEQFPAHCSSNSNGHCLYREPTPSESV